MKIFYFFVDLYAFIPVENKCRHVGVVAEVTFRNFHLVFLRGKVINEI